MFEVVAWKCKERSQWKKTYHVLNSRIKDNIDIVAIPVIKQVDHGEGLHNIKEDGSNEGG